MQGRNRSRKIRRRALPAGDRNWRRNIPFRSRLVAPNVTFPTDAASQFAPLVESPLSLYLIRRRRRRRRRRRLLCGFLLSRYAHRDVVPRVVLTASIMKLRAEVKKGRRGVRFLYYGTCPGAWRSVATYLEVRKSA